MCVPSDESHSEGSPGGGEAGDRGDASGRQCCFACSHKEVGVAGRFDRRGSARGQCSRGGRKRRYEVDLRSMQSKKLKMDAK